MITIIGKLILFLPGFSVKLTSEYFRAKAGNTGWSYDEILPYFKKSMDQQDRKLAQNTQVYGTKGPLVVETPDFKTEASLGFLKAAEILGLSVKDINDGKWNGVHLDNTLRTKYFLKKKPTRKRLSLLIFQVMRLDFLPYKLQLTKEKGLAVRKPF